MTWEDPYDGAKHPDKPEPGDEIHPVAWREIEEARRKRNDVIVAILSFVIFFILFAWMGSQIR